MVGTLKRARARNPRQEGRSLEGLGMKHQPEVMILDLGMTLDIIHAKQSPLHKACRVCGGCIECGECDCWIDDKAEVSDGETP